MRYINEKNIDIEIEVMCPLCKKEHCLPLKHRKAEMTIKDQLISYDEFYFYCSNSNENENTLIPSNLMNKNLLKAKDTYREKNGLLTSEDIKSIREKYGLSQTELSLIMGFGEITVTRYETKQIQERAHDHLLRKFMDDPTWAYGLLKSSQSKFEIDRFNTLCKIFKENVVSNGNESLSRKILENVYINYDVPSEFNGYSLLDIDKTESIISFFASINNLSKSKLMNLLWFADALSYKINGKTMTGLVYSRETTGFLPVGHNEIMYLDNVKSIEETFDDEDYSIIKVLPNENLKFEFPENELNLLNNVKEKFSSFSAKTTSEYIHKEKAYIQISDKDIFSFSFAKYVGL